MANASIKANISENNVNPAKYANIVGAFISFAVFIGVIGWGAQTLMRDSSGVPVVRALEGPSRMAPVNPGGVPASHQGLTVNQVSSSQKTVLVGELLQLAPGPINLQIDDLPIVKQIINEATGLLELKKTDVLEIESAIVEPSTDSDEIIVKLASILTSSTLSSLAPEAPNVMLNASSRPQVRPNSWLQTNLPRKVATRGGEVPLGTLMVQLGAFSDENTALEAWKRLSERYGDYFVGKEATILNGKISEQEIYRLRVYGFNDINESRRLCTALHGQNAECYPVVMN
ncbi:MAG: SPOR domain-containing protein [Planktomarina sp.]|nr:SPOR domain-containing protein [Planktomarina sp.]